MKLAKTVTAVSLGAAKTLPPEETRDYACRVNDSSLCTGAWNLTHDTGIAHTVDWASVLISVCIILLVAYLAMRVTRRFIRRAVSGLQTEGMQRKLASVRKRTPKAFLSTGPQPALRRIQRAETIGALLRSTTTMVIGVIALFAVLAQFSINLGPLIAGAGVATAALAFGAQNILRDFLAGFFIVVEDQYGVGDVIDLGQASGTVEAVTLRITRVRDSDGTLWNIPNGEIKKAGNKSQQWVRALLDFRVALDSDLSQAAEILKAQADNLWKDPDFADIITGEPEVWGPEAVDKDGIHLRLAVKTRPAEQSQVSRALITRVKEAFDEAGIHIAKA